MFPSHGHGSLGPCNESLCIHRPCPYPALVLIMRIESLTISTREGVRAGPMGMDAECRQAATSVKKLMELDLHVENVYNGEYFLE